jgi:catechol 2,3-dioxygenase-like lactoylglutathione lyase family enzyme
MPLRIRGLTHIAIAVRDLDRSLRFYQNLFGSEVRFRDDTSIELRTPGRHDALTLQLAGKEASAGAKGGVLHFGFRLLQPMAADDIAMAVTLAGGTVEEKGEFVLGEPYVFALDPDGYLIEVFYEP